jgi:hypothetical protein
MSMYSYDYLSREERIARIGQLLAKGITLMLQREAAEKQDAEPRLQRNAAGACGASAHSDNASPGPEIADDGEREIFNYLRRVGAASPRDIQRALDVAKVTAFRKLRSLVKAKLIARTGRTTAIRYRVIPLHANGAMVGA